jgi:erythromycin esterase-like protein
MNKMGMLIDQLHDAEMSLSDDYRKIGERHAAEHDLWHNCHTFARQCAARARQLRQTAEHYGKDIGEPHEIESVRRLAAQARRAVANLVGRRPTTALLMLRDLRELYVTAEEANLLWVMLGQAAQAARDAELLETVEVLHRQIISQIKWLKTQVKESTPQVILT